MSAASAGGIFVSYRRDDTRQAAGRLADDLADRFGAKRLFRDIETIELGVDFTVALNQALASCAVMLVLIGDKWLTIQTAAGQRRLDDPTDWIRQEISSALKRGIRVVPVLVDGAQLPAEADLPEDLRPLVRRQALDLADGRWKGDVQRLCDTLDRLPELQRTIGPTPRPPPSPNPAPVPAPAPVAKSKAKLWMGVGAGVLGTALVSSMFNQADSPAPAPAPEPFVAPAPAPLPTPRPSPAPIASIPNLAGMWRTLTGETYHFTQSGNQLQITAQANGQFVGAGTAEIEGQLMRVSLSMQVQGVNLGNLVCDMQAAPDFRRYVGLCMGPNGQTQAQIFR
jgi:TIR domain